MATFTLFPHLPAELRIQIWNMTASPRIVKIRIYLKDPNLREKIPTDFYYRYLRQNRNEYLASPPPAPAILHTCREARVQGLR